MVSNLRVDFKERQHKRLSEALPTAPLPAKKTRSEVSHKEPVSDIPTTQVPIFDIVRSRQELVVSSSTEKNACPTKDGILVGHTLGGDINEKGIPISFPIWEEINALLRKVPCFSTPEPPALAIDAFFPLTCHHFVNLSGDPPITVVPRLPHDTPEFVLQCINMMQQYTAEGKAKVVRFAHFLSKFT